MAKTHECPNVRGTIDAIGGAIGDTGATLDDVVIERLQYDKKSGGMLASGVVKYTTPTDGAVTQDFRRVPVDIMQGASGDLGTMQANGTCEILNLDLGPIFLDLLGLQIDLSPIELDITAVSGPGNLLGNLLCAVAGLLDPGSGLDGLGNLIDRLLRNLSRLINQLLGGLGGFSLASLV